MQAQRLRVLLVEDELGDTKLMLHALRQARSPSFSVFHEATLADAIGRLGMSAAFDVVLLDLNLPDSSGVETLSRLQAADPAVPVVITTGLDDPLFAEQALEAGAQDYLVKGDVTERAVARSIRYAITRKHAEDERKVIADRLAHSLAAECGRLDEELSQARTMQFDLLPTKERLEQCRHINGLDVASFFEPSSDIGGDLWGCVHGVNGKTVFYTFDFSGHGVGAALNVFRLHALLGELDGRIADPAATLGNLNATLHTLLPCGQYATIFLAVIDTVAGTLTWAAGGAPPPILFDGDGRFQLLDTRGRPLGVSGSTQYANRVLPFPPRSSLFLYSDVMTESLVNDEDMLGEDALVAMVREFHRADGIDIPGLASRFIDTVGSPMDDDMTAVCISRVVETGLPGDIVDAKAWRGDAGLTTVPFSGEPSGATAPLILTSRRVDAIETGLAPPYSGFIEITATGLGDVGLGCLDVVDRGGMCLSLSVATAWSCGVAALLCTALRRRYRVVRDWNAVDLCLSEAVANAIVHGCLGVGSGLRESRSGLERYNDTVFHGLRDPVRAAKRVEVSAVCLPDGRLELTVSDHGNGFDFNRHLTRVEPLSAKHGRGLALIRETARSVTWLDRGRTLVITI